MFTKRTLIEQLQNVPDLTRIYLTLDADGEQPRPIDEVRVEDPTLCRPMGRVLLLPAYKRAEWGMD